MSTLEFLDVQGKMKVVVQNDAEQQEYSSYQLYRCQQHLMLFSKDSKVKLLQV